MNATATIATAEWLADRNLQQLLSALSSGGEKAMVVGGAVRNTLMGQPVTDIDIATTTLPDETVRRIEGAGMKAVPTGYEHGTITAVAGGKGYEVTTLRRDVDTDGRRAKVAFGKDWKTDAERRDFTINALYADANGSVVDLVGGLEDIRQGYVRFIGHPDDRIHEDYLRILRFFRFFAWYGNGRPDAEGLKACARNKAGLSGLSAERVWAELRKLLAAPDPSRALLWMRQSGALSAVLPETEKWGIDAIHELVDAENAIGWAADALLRLESIVPPDASRMAGLAKRLRLSNADAARLQAYALHPEISATIDDAEFDAMLYRGDVVAAADRLKLAIAASRRKASEDRGSMRATGRLSTLLERAQEWRRPVFPIKGTDLIGKGAVQGPEVGERLRKLEDKWIASRFSLSREDLLQAD